MKVKGLFLFAVSLLIFIMMIGCGDKGDGVVGVAMYDDGEAPAIPMGVQAQCVYLYTNPTLGYNEKKYKVIVRWNKVTTNINGAPKDNIIGYKIYRDRTDKPIGIVDKDTLIFEDNSEDLQEGKTYAYYVAAFDSLLRETRSDAQRVRITPTMASGHIPDRPLNVLLIKESNSSLTLVWSKPENISDLAEDNDPIDSYMISRKVGETGVYEIIAQVSANTFFFNDPTVVEGQRYFYRVRAITKSGLLGIESEEKSMVLTYDYNDDGSAPGAPKWGSIMEVSEDGNQHARKLMWNAPEFNDNGSLGQDSAGDVQGYKIYRSESYAGPYYLTAIVSNSTSWTDTNNLDSSGNPVDYWYRVAAYDYSGNTGDMNQPLKIGMTPVPAPQGFTGEVDNYDYIWLSWTKEPGYNYNIYESKNKEAYRLIKSGFNDAAVADYGTLKYSPRKLVDDSEYYYKISAVNKATGYESDKTYYVKVMRTIEGTTSQKMVIEGESIVNAMQVRNVLDALNNWNNGWGALYSNQYQLSTDVRTVNGNSVQVLRFDPHGASEGYSYNNTYWWNIDGTSVNSTTSAGIGINTDRNYEDQMRFMWMPTVSGKYNFRVDYVATNTSGIYWVLIRTDSGVIGQGNQVNAYTSGSDYSDYFSWTGLYVTAYQPVYIVFCGARQGNAIQTTHAFYLDKITIERADQ